MGEITRFAVRLQVESMPINSAPHIGSHVVGAAPALACATQQAVSMACARCWTGNTSNLSEIFMGIKLWWGLLVYLPSPSVQSVAASNHATKPNLAGGADGANGFWIGGGGPVG